MSETALHSTPRPRDVLREQLRTVGLALRAPATVATVLAAGVALLVALGLAKSGTRIDFHPELSMVPGIAGLVLPLAVWWGEERFGPGFFWTLPVDRGRHALTRVAAGWMWLMTAVLAFVLWLLVLALLTGGNVLGDETVRVVSLPPLAPAVGIDPAAVRTASRAAQPLFWLVPFTAASGAYLLASALALGTRRPLRWIVGCVLGFFLVLGTVEGARAVSLRLALTRVLEAVFSGPYGLDALLTARSESLHTVVTLATGPTVEVWRGLPTTGDWAAATLLWTAAGMIALWLAARRHGEGRRG
ncbi:MAG TPA: hypothetical protein VFJ82_22820 [Longimicrobium sp.]|nr:hypothetical protein [Longimicrobium sp.]